MLPALPFPETSRLVLRPLATSDARELFAIVVASRDELGRFMSWPREVREVEHARRFIRLGRDGWLSDHTVRMGIFERATGALAGSVEIDGVDLRRSQAELGYWIRSDRARQGYATEAAGQLVRYAFETLRLHKLRADVAVGNVPSARVLARLGFQQEGTLREDRPVGGVFTDHWRFGLLEREYRARPAWTGPASSGNVGADGGRHGMPALRRPDEGRRGLPRL